jgi:hypothetical protein
MQRGRVLRTSHNPIFFKALQGGKHRPSPLLMLLKAGPAAPGSIPGPTEWTRVLERTRRP